jgi:hypothetical protein
MTEGKGEMQCKSIMRDYSKLIWYCLVWLYWKREPDNAVSNAIQIRRGGVNLRDLSKLQVTSNSYWRLLPARLRVKKVKGASKTPKPDRRSYS